MNKDTNKTGRESWVIPFSTHRIWVVTEEPRQKGHEVLWLRPTVHKWLHITLDTVRAVCCKQTLLSTTQPALVGVVTLQVLASVVKICFLQALSIHATCKCCGPSLIESAKCLHSQGVLSLFTFTIFTYPLTARVIAASKMTSQPVSSIFLCSPGLSIP